MTIFRGDSLVYDVPQVKDRVTGVPIDLTGGRMWFTAKKNYIDPDSLAPMRGDTVGGEVVFTNPTNGQARVTIGPTATLLFPDGDVLLVFDVQFKSVAGIVTTVDAGTIRVRPDVTRGYT